MPRPNYRQRERIRHRLMAIGAPCHICGKPIDYTLTTWTDPADGKVKRHPLSFEYDHRVALANGGHPTSMENAAPAHRICNQRKGAKVPVSKRDQRYHANGVPVEIREGVPRERANGLPNSRAW